MVPNVTFSSTFLLDEFASRVIHEARIWPPRKLSVMWITSTRPMFRFVMIRACYQRDMMKSTCPKIVVEIAQKIKVV